MQLASQWPQTQATVDIWKILPAGDAAESFTQTDFIEASFHFTLNGEYYGGYLCSVAMGRKEAEKPSRRLPVHQRPLQPCEPG